MKRLKRLQLVFVTLLVFIVIGGCTKNYVKITNEEYTNLEYLKINTDKCLVKDELSILCLENFFKEYLKDKTVKETLHQISQLSEYGNKIETDCHVLAHALGRQALAAKGTIDRAFEECSQECGGGCYHGVVEKFFLGKDSDKNINLHSLDLSDIRRKVKEVCSNPSSDISATGCWHGAGHGLMLLLDYNLSQALAMCDIFDSVDEQRECYTGVFMENVLAAQKEKRVLKKSDLQFPCNTIDEKYKEDCYENLLIWWEENGLSAQESINECSKAGNYTPACIEGLGGNLIDFVGGNFNEIAMICSSLNAELKQRCIKGAVESISELGAKEASEFCSAFKNKQDQNYCKESAGE